jgi:DNA invertase Pin-like site-specific DNA recombinase
VGVGAVIYARISEDHERAESVPTQIANATRHAERMGWDVARVFKDEGRSGFTGEVRPGFEDMLKFLSRGRRAGLDRAASRPADAQPGRLRAPDEDLRAI